MLTRWISWIGCAALALGLLGCDIDNCTKYDEGCLGGTAKNGSECGAGLKAVNGQCVDPKTDSYPPPSDGKCADGFVKDGDQCKSAEADGGGETDVCGGCSAGELCMTDSKKCVNFCEVPDEIPGLEPTPARILCGGDTDTDADYDDSGSTDGQPDGKDLTFEEICINRCLLECRWREWFCGESGCTADDCDTMEEKQRCIDDIGLTGAIGSGALVDGANRQKLAESCAAVRSRTCDSDSAAKCTNGDAPRCGQVGCSNECAGATRNLFDGYCDDGAYSNADSWLCPYGSDCADCGARRGPPGPLDMLSDLKWGALCGRSDVCVGADRGRATCLEFPGPVDGIYRCVPDCTDNRDLCPEGMSCTQLSSGAVCTLDKDAFKTLCDM